MAELIKSMIGYSWATSLFGVQQFANVLAPSGNGGLGKAIAGLTDRVLTPKGMMRGAFDIMQQSAGAFQHVMPGRDGAVVCREFQNKLETFSLFEHVDAALKLPVGACPPLVELIRRATTLGPYFSVWAVEGAGHYYTEACWSNGAPHGLLQAANTADLPSASLCALHAGMGLSFANRALKVAEPGASSAGIRQALEWFIRLCQENSREGYLGIAYESIGLVARNLYPQMVAVIDRQLAEIGQEFVDYFWHGVGRGLYFVPANFMLFRNAPWSAVDMALREPPHESGRMNALAGLSWAITLVNIRHPEILEAFLRHHGELLCASDAFSNGVASAILIWRDCSENDPYIQSLCRHAPSDPTLGERWKTHVTLNCERALEDYGALRSHHRLGDLFRYRNLTELAGELPRRTAAGGQE